jgi:UDP-N-acetylmuramoylalanine--D-glutamate ligase
MKPAYLPQQVLVMGLGVHGGGLGVACWLLHHGVSVTITDLASAEQLAKPLATLNQAAAEAGATDRLRYVLGEHRAEDFTNHPMVVVNPAVRPDSRWLQMATSAGASVETEMTLFFRACPAPIIGITGTKGKSTTAMLTGAILRTQHPDTVIAGNMRVSALETLQRITPTTPVILELSSFQLMRLGAAHLSPTYGCITNFSPDHLNYHGTLEEYGTAKRQIFCHQSSQGVIVLNHADVQAGIWGEYFPGRMLTFSADPAVGTQAAADCHIDPAGYVVLYGERIVHQRDIRLAGRHNLENVQAAVMLAHLAGGRMDQIGAAVGTFGGIDHRLELVRELDGVSYINDTTATNPVAAQAGLTSFDAPIVLIAGGADKGLPTSALAQTIVERATGLVLLAGSATPRLQADIDNLLIQGHSCCLSPDAIQGPFDDFANAITAAQQLATVGDVVLLSPGCASFGMFRNEFHRGEEFRRIVQTLTSRRISRGNA